MSKQGQNFSRLKGIEEETFLSEFYLLCDAKAPSLSVGN